MKIKENIRSVRKYDKISRKQDSKELSPRPLENAPKLSMLIKLFKILVHIMLDAQF